MNLVDSSGWLEFFAGGMNADLFAEPLTDRERLIIPTIIIFEVFKVVLRERGENAALQAAALLRQGSVIELSEAISLRAARLSVAHKLPLADSVILATAKAHNALIWTMDVHFSDIEGVKYFRKIA